MGYMVYRSYDNRGRLRVPRNAKIRILVKDLPKNSHEKVEVKCDYCGKIMLKVYQSYTSGHKVVQKDACQKCNNLYKVKEVNRVLYGVDNVFELSEVKDKIRDTNMRKYGHDHHYKSTEFAELYLNRENNPNWRGGTATELQLARGSVEYRDWRKDVLERDKFTCIVCGDDNNDMHAHHLESFAKNKDLRFDVDNGVTLCILCHDPSKVGSFHNVYGTINNTKSQFYEYLDKAEKREV